MNSLKTIKIASISALTAALLAPAISMAEVSETNAEAGNGGHSLVHRVSHSIADSKAYTRSAASGYKWGKGAEQTESSSGWAESTPARSGYKWGNSTTSAKPDAQSYAGASSYQWGSMSFSEQAAYKWGVRSFADQSAYKWGVRSFADQSAYKWGVRSFADQSAYKWGVR